MARMRIQIWSGENLAGSLPRQVLELLGHGSVLIGRHLQFQAHFMPNLGESFVASLARSSRLFDGVGQQQAQAGHVARLSFGLQLLDLSGKMSDSS